MEKLIANLSKKVSKKTLNGRDYLVAPLTLIVEGVLNGSKGPLYYPSEEVTKDVSIWNHMPIVVNHPVINGQPVTARSAEVLNSFGIGLVLNSKGTDGKLVAEGWFDIEATRNVDERIYASLAANKSIELSTGLFTTNEAAEDGATFNGKSYDFIARDYKPDHLAILPDSIGACSVADGCGVLVNSAGEIKVDGVLVFNQPSHDELRDMLNDLIRKAYGDDAWVSEVFNKYLIYRLHEKLYKVGYTADQRSDNRIKLSEKQPVEVVRTVLYKNITQNNKGVQKMDLSKEDRKKLVDDLIANECCWEEDNRETLNSLSDKTLESLGKQATEIMNAAMVANAAKEGFEDQQGNAHKFNTITNQWETTIKIEEPVKNEEKSNKEQKPQTTEEWLNSAPEEVRNTLKYAKDIENKEKALLINKLTANVSDGAKATLSERLQSKPLDELQDLVLLVPEKETPTANYAGASSPTGNTKKSESRGSGIPMPEIDFSQK